MKRPGIQGPVERVFKKLSERAWKDSGEEEKMNIDRYVLSFENGHFGFR